MNQLKVGYQKAIQALAARGWSYRRIARELGIHRETVARYVRLATAEPAVSSKPAIPTAGSDPKPAISTAGSPGRSSLCAPYQELIEEKLAVGLSAQRIFQDLKSDHDFSGSYESVKRFVRALGRETPLPFRRLECDPGEEAQVDFGKGAPTKSGGGGSRRPPLFRIVLSHSRKAYSEVVSRETTEMFIRALENAFFAFGGVPKVLVIDNLLAAVKRADFYDPELNPKVESFCRHYGVTILPTKPYTPRHKGKVESGIGYAQDNALKGRRFGSLQAQNVFLKDWEANVADTRIHGTTRRQVRKVFEEAERPALLPLPLDRFPFFHEGRRKVHRDGHVEIERSYYPVPPEYLNRDVWARWDTRVVRIFNRKMEPIAVHCRVEPGHFASEPSFIPKKKISAIEKGADYLLQKARRIGLETGRWAEAMHKARGIQGLRILVGLLSLAKRYEAEKIEEACRVARGHGAFRLRVLRELIKRQPPDQRSIPFVSEHPIIRDISCYAERIREATQGGKEARTP
ncbi:MAG: IS21 family transposase [Candidatus Krumholzibacteriia bacterium]